MLDTISKNKLTSLENIKLIIWYNGKFIDIEELKIHPLTHSLHYSGSVFEGVRAINGYIFKCEQHTSRLFHSARQMRLNIDFSEEVVNHAHYELLKKNNLTSAYIRPIVWRSTDSVRILPENPVYHIMIAAWASEPRAHKPLRVNISNWVKPGKNMFPKNVKSSSQYGLLQVAASEARDLGYDDSILLDEKGYIAECTSCNIFFIKNNQLYTPKTDYCLDGITRQTIIEVSRENKIPCHEVDINLDELAVIDAAFVTGTAVGVKPIQSIITSSNLYALDADNKILKFLGDIYQKLSSGTL
ncbi:MAG: aminotransferase class IV [Rickettsiaceae bacterium]|nr:aminotransferase class IV [Rickettsiaceae bacterium]